MGVLMQSLVLFDCASKCMAEFLIMARVLEMARTSEMGKMTIMAKLVFKKAETT